MARLTNAIRKSFLDAVMNSKKPKSKFNRKFIEEEIVKRVNATAPQVIVDLYKLYPRAIQRQQIPVKEFDDPGTGDGGIYYSNSCYVWVLPETASLKNIEYDDLKAGWDEYKAEREKRKELRCRLSQIANECTTVEALASTLPKLKKYIPKYAMEPPPKKQLPVALAHTLVDDLARYGIAVED